jgi:hypothetical protein
VLNPKRIFCKISGNSKKRLFPAFLKAGADSMDRPRARGRARGPFCGAEFVPDFTRFAWDFYICGLSWISDGMRHERKKPPRGRKAGAQVAQVKQREERAERI